MASNTLVAVDINAAGDTREVPILVKNTMIHSLEVLDHEDGAKQVPVIVKLIGPAPATGYRIQLGYESPAGDIVRDVIFGPGQQAAKALIELPAVDKKTEVKLIAKWRNMQEVAVVLHRSPQP